MSIKNILDAIKTFFTKHRCDNCGRWVDKVWMTEEYLEGGFLECAECIDAKKKLQPLPKDFMVISDVKIDGQSVSCADLYFKLMGLHNSQP